MNNLNISRNAIFEKYYKGTIMNINIAGYIDCINDNDIYEFKCVTKLTNEYFLQLAVYMYLYLTNTSNNNKSFYLYNILSGEKYELKSSITELSDILEYLIHMKYYFNNDIDDIKFIKKIKKYYKKYYVSNISSSELNDVLESSEKL